MTTYWLGMMVINDSKSGKSRWVQQILAMMNDYSHNLAIQYNDDSQFTANNDGS